MRTRKTLSSRTAARRITGQGMTEYIIVVALIAIAAVAAVSFFGSAVKTQFAALGGELVDVDGAAAIAAKGQETAAEVTAAKTKATLGTYTKN